MYIKELIVNKGPAFKRYIPMARGRSRAIDKFTSHISVKLGVDVPEGKEGDGDRDGDKKKESPASAPAGATAGKKETKETKGVEAGKKIKKTDEKKVKLEAEEGAPVARVPGNPAKQSAEGEAAASGDDPHAGGSQNKQKGGEFTQFRQGSRGE